MDTNTNDPKLLVICGLFVAGIAALAWDSIQRMKKASQPLQKVHARVFAKRQDISGGNASPIRTWHYVTFEISGDGSRREFCVIGAFFSSLRENETGCLTYRGDECLGFVRGSHPQAEAPRPPAKGWFCGHCNAVVPDRQSKCPTCGSMCLVAPTLPE